jgi:hypothetical protein
VYGVGRCGRAREARYDQVTTAHVVAAYRELATPFFLIGELDQVLRQLISRTFTLEEVTSLCDLNGSRAIQSFDDLEMGDYQTRRGLPSDPGKPGRVRN